MLAGRFRSVLLGASALAVLVAMPDAGATPYAGSYRYLQPSTVALAGSDGARWLLKVEATQSDGVGNRPEQYLYLDLSRCAGSSCVSRGTWVRALTSAEIAIAPDATSARLRTVLGGLPLDVRLEHEGLPGPGGTTAGPIVVGGPHPLDAQPGLDTFYDGSGTFTLGRNSCSAAGYMGLVAKADTVGRFSRERRTAPPGRLPAALTGARSLSC